MLLKYIKLIFLLVLFLKPLITSVCVYLKVIWSSIVAAQLGIWVGSQEQPYNIMCGGTYIYLSSLNETCDVILQHTQLSGMGRWVYMYHSVHLAVNRFLLYKI